MNICFKNSNHIIYADDTKIYRVIASEFDCQDLQNDLHAFYEYCKKNDLFLNVNKCFVISFSRKITNIHYDYNIAGKQINRVDFIRDLGITLDSKLTFNLHIDNICKKAYKSLGMILRIGKPFRRPFTYKVLYSSYVRSLLEFGSVIWNPQYQVHKDRLERIQKIFLKSLCYRTGSFFETSTESARHFNILSLNNRRIYLDVIFYYKILTNIINCPNLLQNILFKIPYPSIRPRELFHVSFARTNYTQNTFFRRVPKYYNNYLKDIDPFQHSIRPFKKLVKSKL